MSSICNTNHCALNTDYYLTRPLKLVNPDAHISKTYLPNFVSTERRNAPSLPVFRAEVVKKRSERSSRMKYSSLPRLACRKVNFSTRKLSRRSTLRCMRGTHAHARGRDNEKYKFRRMVGFL